MKPCAVRTPGGTPCRQLAAPASDHCPWHNPSVDKRDAYVARALAEALRLSGGDGRGFHLVGLLWPEAGLAGVDLAGADLRDAVLSGADLQGVTLSGANLRRTHLVGADLRHADLRDCDLTGANLARADLRGARLQGARLDGTVLVGSNLEEADLSGALVNSFTWNRATRFQGVKGFGGDAHAPTGDGDGGDDETRPFLAPLALSAETREGPANDRTRLYEAGARQPRRSTTEHELPLAAGPPASPAPAAPAARSDGRLGRLLLGGTALWALVASGTTWSLLGDRAATVIAEPIAQPIDNDPANRVGSEQLRDLTGKLRRLQEGQEALATRLRGSEEERLRLQVDLARLRGVEDDRDRQLQQRATAERERDRLRDANGRLDTTARILADGVDRLQGEVAVLRDRDRLRTASRQELEQLGAERDRLAGALAAATAAAAAAEHEAHRLGSELAQVRSSVERLLTRIEGTRLEGLLGGDDQQRGPLLALRPGEPLALSGGDVLLTLRVEPGPGRDEVTARLVVQRSERGALPDLGLVFYGPDQQPIRRFSASFPGEGGSSQGRFASLNTAFSSPVFPTAVRIAAAAGLEERPAVAGHP